MELGITKRFVGEELLESGYQTVYEAMKRILPNYGIEVEEIKRLEDRIRGSSVLLRYANGSKRITGKR